MMADIIPIDLNDRSFMAGYVRLSDENITRIEEVIKTWMNLPQTAKWFSKSLTLAKNMGEISESGWTRVYRTHVEQMNLPVAAEALKNFADIYGNISASLNRNHSDFTGKCMNNVAQWIGTIGKANDFNDMIPVCSAMVKGMSDHMETCMTDVTETLNSLNSALEIWMRKSLDAYDSSDGIKAAKQPSASKTAKAES